MAKGKSGLHQHPHKHPHARHEPEQAELDLPDDIAVESTLRLVRSLAGEVELQDFDDVERYVSQMDDKVLANAAEVLRKDPRAFAQQIAFQAMAIDDEDEAHEMIEAALSFDPECLDALHLQAEETSEEISELLESLEPVVEAADRRMAQAQLPASPVWRFVETAPYARLKTHYADLMRLEGRFADAIPQLEQVLAIVPEDNYGASAFLLGCYLSVGDLEHARALIERHKDDETALLWWARALERFLAGDRDEAARLLAEARRRNRLVETFMTTGEPTLALPEGSVSEDEIEEAHACAYAIGPAWVDNPAARDWLATA